MPPWITTRVRLFILLLLAGAATPSYALDQPIPALPAPSGLVVSVSTVGQLFTALQQLQSNTTIVLSAGTYALGGNHLEIDGGVVNVALRGATGNRADVVIDGGGMSNSNNDSAFGIEVDNAQNVTIADLSVGNVYYSAIQLNAPSGCQQVLIHNVRCYDTGEQLIKSNPITNSSGIATDGVDNSRVEYSLLEYTTSAPSDYTNGIDVHHGANWDIMCNEFINIRGPAGVLAGPTVLMWNGSSNCTCERNWFFNCQRGIFFGIEQRPEFNDCSGGVIRNNMIYLHNGDNDDAPIAVWDSPNTQILHNTCIGSTYMDSIEYRFSTCTGIVIENNLTDQQILDRDGATATTISGNDTSALPSWFVNTSIGDLHLVATATAAFQAGVFPVSDCTNDWAGNARPTTSAPDLGAHQYNVVAGTSSAGSTTTSTSGSGTTSASSTSASGSASSSATGGSGASGTGSVSTPTSGSASGGGCGIGGALGALAGSALLLLRCVARRPG